MYNQSLELSKYAIVRVDDAALLCANLLFEQKSREQILTTPLQTPTGRKQEHIKNKRRADERRNVLSTSAKQNRNIN